MVKFEPDPSALEPYTTSTGVVYVPREWALAQKLTMNDCDSCCFRSDTQKCQAHRCGGGIYMNKKQFLIKRLKG